MKTLSYIVTGTGRSGTCFMARFLTSLGIPCGHESIFDYGGIDVAMYRLSNPDRIKTSYASTVRYTEWVPEPLPVWLDDPSEIVAESSYMAAPYLGHTVFCKVPTIHVVRNPIRVVNSFCNYLNYFREARGTNAYETFIYNHFPELTSEELTPYERCALYWVLWNKMIETALTNRDNRYFVKIEGGTDGLLNFLGLQGTKKPLFSDKKVNSFESPGDRFRLSELPDGSIKRDFVELGERYGYSMGSEYLMA